MSFRWGEERTLKFVSKYLEHECLWNIRSILYRNKQKKQSAYADLERVMNIPGFGQHEIKMKIKNIRSTYSQELKKIKDSKKSGAEPDAVYVPSVKWFPLLDAALQTLTSIYTQSESNSDEKQPPKPRKVTTVERKVTTLDNFMKVKRNCVMLVKENYISASVLDLEAFQNILKLIPMSSEEREQLTSEAVLRLVEEAKEDNYETVEETLDQEEDQSFSEHFEIPKVGMVKTEIETTDCTCGKDVTEPYHEDDCPAKQNYFNFFEATVDSAKCNICHSTIKWNSTEDLKHHLKNKHPDLTLDLEIDDSRANSVSSREDIEGVFLEDNEPEPPERKRKRRDQEVRYTEVEVDNNLSYHNLDKFGQYVASLLAHIPKKRSLRLQMRIVQKLLEEQAAAG